MALSPWLMGSTDLESAYTVGSTMNNHTSTSSATYSIDLQQ